MHGTKHKRRLMDKTRLDKTSHSIPRLSYLSNISNKHSVLYSIPMVCGSALLLLGLMSINPSSIIADSLHGKLGSSNGSVYAEEVKETGTAISLSIDGLTGGEDGGSINSTVNATNYDTAYISHNVTVSGSNIDSYSLQLTAADGYTSSLVNNGGEGGATLASIAGAGGAIGSSMEDNTWGYSWGEIDTDVSTLPYYTLPEYGSESEGVLESVANVANGTVEFTKKLSFGAKFNGVPAGHYTTTALLSLAASPKEVSGKSWDELIYMQDMNPIACASQPTPATGETNVPTKTLTDSRDDSTYTIAKLKDGNCWMTQNLRIVNKKLTKEDSDVEEEFELPASVTLSSDDNPKKFSTDDKNEKRVYYIGNKNYGAYYNWFTATAGTGDINTTDDDENTYTDAPGSICPRGWRLPTGGDTAGEFYILLNNFTKGSQITTAPYNFVYSGHVRDSELSGTISSSYYWASALFRSDFAYHISIYINSLSLTGGFARYIGSSVRCVAR